MRFNAAWAVSLPLVALVFGLLGPAAAFPVAGGLVQPLVDLRAALIAAGGEDVAFVRGRDDDGADERWHPSRHAKRVRRGAGAEEEDDDDGGGSGSDDEGGGDAPRGGARGGGGTSSTPPLRRVYRVVEAVFAAAIRVLGAEGISRLVPLAGTPQVCAGGGGMEPRWSTAGTRAWTPCCL